MTTLLSIFNKLTSDSLFAYHQALYWYCSENHEGQFTELFSILSQSQYKPSATEKAEDVDFDVLGFPISHDSMVTLATALRLYALTAVVISEDYRFAGLYYFEAKNLYLAEYRQYNEDAEYSTFYAVYSIDESGTIIDETVVD